MDPRRFDTLAKFLSRTNTRRRLMGLVAALPLAGALGGLLGEEHADGQGSGAGVGGGGGRRRRRRGRHHPGQDKKHRKGKRKRPGCKPTTCAAEGKTCGSLADGCGTTLDCGACTCATGCADCQTCNRDTGQCDPVTNGTTCDDGDACTQTDTCQDGACVGSTPVVCATGQVCVAGSCACTAASCSSGCCDGAVCRPGSDDGVCGTGGGRCTACTGVNRCRDRSCVPTTCGTPGGVCRVFVTNAQYSGNLGGLSGADAKCQAAADAAGLGGAYRAWLSTGASSPATDATFTRASGPYRLVNGTRIAADWADLTDGTLDAPINVTESGVTVGGNETVWTNTRPNGTVGGIGGGLDCGSWASNDAFGGEVGSPASTDAFWTDSSVSSCRGTDPTHLYCFQQS